MVIAICDDEEVIRHKCSKICKELISNYNRSFEIIQYEDGKDIDREDIDILILDIEMPIVDGLSVKEMLQNKGIDTYIIFVTSIIQSIHWIKLRQEFRINARVLKPTHPVVHMTYRVCLKYACIPVDTAPKFILTITHTAKLFEKPGFIHLKSVIDFIMSMSFFINIKTLFNHAITRDATNFEFCICLLYILPNLFAIIGFGIAIFNNVPKISFFRAIEII